MLNDKITELLANSRFTEEEIKILDSGVIKNILVMWDKRRERSPLILSAEQMRYFNENPDTVDDTLKGQPFIGRIEFYDDSQNSDYGQWTARECSSCFYRNFDGNTNGDCHIEGNIAKLHFGFKPSDFLPKQIDGKETGNYCPAFLDLGAE